MNLAKEYIGIGCMSGTSMDGLDIALCRFTQKQNKWSFEICQAETMRYNNLWKTKLTMASSESAANLISLNHQYGNFIGQQINAFIKKNKLIPDFIASHGHTVFHQPENHFTLQIGSGCEIAAVTRINTVSDFRTMDVALGGQGAPLVPFGDRYLFGEYNYCLNLGGFSNISFEQDGNRKAFDICPVNIVFNQLVSVLGLDFDENGIIASNGVVHEKLLLKLNNLEYYNLPFPKSLGREWFENCFMPIVESENIPLENKLRTVSEHIAVQIANAVQLKDKKSVLVTGGGAYNDFLIECMKQKIHHDFIIPENNIVEFKEALIFAFLGLQRILNKNNCLSSVTGAIRNCCGGAVYLG